ncbi:MAG: hypothetical protein JW922_08995 [Paludibacteraceae bacterium]|nr:hypothetical protein [Paludibacteraceae bacterium]
MRAILLLVVLSFVMESCTIYQYISSKQTVPVFSEKNQLQVELAVNPFNFYGAGIAYSFKDHVGFFCDASYYDKSYGPSEFLIGETGYFLESNILDFNGAIGYFNRTNRFAYEVFTGIGYGTNDYKNIDYRFPDGINIGPNDTLFFDSKFYKFFIQPDISLNLTDKFHVALSTRFSANNYNLLNKRGLDSIQSVNYRYGTTFYNYFQGNQSINIYAIEPCLTFSLGTDFVKFKQQFIVPAFISNKKVNCRPISMYLSVSFSLYELSQKFKKSASLK